MNNLEWAKLWLNRNKRHEITGMDDQLDKHARRILAEESLKVAMQLFLEKMQAEYITKAPKQGDSWLYCDIEVLVNHLEKHMEHVRQKQFGDNQLAGLGLLAMFILYRREKE